MDAGGLAPSLPPQQYLGDLEENSPLPFSIPIDVGGSSAGTYPVALKVTYKDNLRQLHNYDFTSDVQFVPEVVEDEASSGQGMNTAIPIAVGVAVAAGIAAVVFLRRRKRNALKRSMTEGKQDDFESILDSQRAEKRLDRK